MPRHGQFRLLTTHYALFQLAVASAGGFIGAYLMRLGFSLSFALVAYAGLLMIRFGLRFVALGAVRRLGYRRTVIAGAALSALQFLPLIGADRMGGLLAWVLLASLAEAVYWPVYHAAAAVTGGGASRGRELGIRTAVCALVGIVGPLMGGFLLEHLGPPVGFGIASVLTLLSVLPLLSMGEIPAGAVPSLREAVRGFDRAGIAAFAADGWMASGLALAWPMILFTALGSGYEAFGMANAMAGLVGAVAGLLCGRAIDRGQRDRYLLLVCLALLLGFALRAGAGWSPAAAAIANATGAAVSCLYVPVLMSVIYDRAKRSGAAYAFHFAAETGWDTGAAAGCLAAAAVAAVATVPSLAVLPASLGVIAIYRSVRGERAPATAGFAAEPVPAG
ncbi:MFS transporter [Muricoccus pecuniae]|uniref:MFS family permease n=1 Tax=Muricoccus pecuniae TaxID=693023 RepID=A0A840Y595_9PROT|nr:MFS transporter [Roseomonas pecuniae]MBB5696298.1 MFS family permease [Roseomonas pecuniae]